MVHQLINSLTNDEDHRQELWIHYLSGNATSSFSYQLEKLKLLDEDYNELQQLVFQLADSPLSQDLLDIVSTFSELEKSITFWLLLGITIDKISSYKGISEVRIRQIIATIRNHNGWEKWLSNGTSQTKKDTD